MKKLLVLVLVIFVTICFLLLLLFLRKPSAPSQTVPAPTQESSVPLTISSTIPAQNSKGVSVSTSINITFNSPPNVEDVSIAISPELKSTTTRFENTIIVAPSGFLERNTTYTVTVSSQKLGAPYSFSFTTSSRASQGSGPDPEAVREMENELRNKYPDSFLSNHLPHSESTFDMTSYLNWNTGVSGFIVALKGKDVVKSKNDAVLWMKSLLLTDQQIATLNISYQNSSVAKLKELLPYYGTYFSIDYDKSFDKTTITISNAHRVDGDAELDSFLKTKSIQSRSEINNLEVRYL